MTINATGTKAIANDLTVNGTTTVQAIDGLNGGKIVANGNVAFNDSLYGGTAQFELGGGNNQSVSAAGGMVRNLIVNKSGGTATLNNDLIIEGSFSRVAGDFVTAGRTLTLRGSGLNLDTNALVLGNVTLDSNAVLSLASDMIIDGSLHIAGVSGSSNGNGHQIFVTGDYSSSDIAAVGNVNVTLNGSNDQTISGDDLFDGTLTINKTAGIVRVGDTLVLDGSGQQVVVQAGTLDLNDQTINANGSVTVSGGTLMGSGTITNDLVVQSGGTVALTAASSASYQQLTVGGSATISGATLSLDVAGNTVGGLLNDVLISNTLTGTWEALCWSTTRPASPRSPATIRRPAKSTCS